VAAEIAIGYWHIAGNAAPLILLVKRIGRAEVLFRAKF
jgi:hypothetical protein